MEKMKEDLRKLSYVWLAVASPSSHDRPLRTSRGCRDRQGSFREHLLSQGLCTQSQATANVKLVWLYICYLAEANDLPSRWEMCRVHCDGILDTIISVWSLGT